MHMKIAVALTATALLVACGDEPAAPEQGIKEYMAETVQPTAEVYWDSVQYISDETGSHEILPTTEEDWERTRQAAEDLGEIGRTLMTPAYSEGRGGDWNQFAQGLIDVARQAEQAAVDQDVDAVFEVGGTIYSVCSACHQIYPPAEGEIPAAQAASEEPA